MAALNHDYRNGSSHSKYPSGSCNYRDLNHGQWAPICGCRRFWVKPIGRVRDLDSEEGRAWCFCGHHACYHDVIEPGLINHTSVDATDDQGDTASQSRYRNGAGPDDVSIRAVTEDHRCGKISTVATAAARIVRSGLGLQGVESQPGIWQAINTYGRNQAAASSEVGSTLPSTAPPSITGHYGAGIDDVSMQHTRPQPRLMAPPMYVPCYLDLPHNEPGSATEVNTPSLRGTPDLRQDQMMHNQATVLAVPTNLQRSPPNSSSNARRPDDHDTKPAAEVAKQIISQSQLLQARAASPASSIAQPPSKIIRPEPSKLLDASISQHELRNIVRTCVQRLDLLESLSMSHVPLEEVEDRFENLHSRMIDIEGWKTDHEAQQQALRPSRSRKRRRVDQAHNTSSSDSDSSLDSDAAISTSSALSATAAVYAAYTGRFDMMEQRIAVLEDQRPTFSHPWLIELVLLPWGRDLRGIWTSCDTDLIAKDKADSTKDTWNGVDSDARNALGECSPTANGWTSDSIMAWADNATQWLCPRACGPNSTVYQRLASRGLVRQISLCKPDANSIVQGITEAYAGAVGDFQRVDSSDKGNNAQYHALASPFVPLRKIRKSSRLRFLGRSEMITSACWDAAFLDASVFMQAKGGQRRLYLTTPQAYIQSGDSVLTWSDIKALATTDASDLEDNHDVPYNANSVDRDACWAYNHDLDAPPNQSQSFDSNASGQSRWSVQSQSSIPPVTEPLAPPISPLSERQQPRHVRQHSVSLPTSMVEIPAQSAGGSKRRVASFDLAAMNQKQRRSSVASEAARNGALFTPRLSREPPSPFNSENQAETRSEDASSTNRRQGGTPFAYATPHSNTNNTVATVYLAGEDGDTEADTDIIPRSDRNEEEWEGVREDEQVRSSFGQDRQVDVRSESSRMETDNEEDNDEYEEE